MHQLYPHSQVNELTNCGEVDTNVVHPCAHYVRPM